MTSRALLCAALSIGATACGKDQWTGFVYPNKHNLGTHVEIGNHDSLEACRAAAVAALRAATSLEAGDYECGLNCKPSSTMGGLSVCDRTER